MWESQKVIQEGNKCLRCGRRGLARLNTTEAAKNLRIPREAEYANLWIRSAIKNGQVSEVRR